MNTATPVEQRSVPDVVAQVAGTYITGLQNGYLVDNSSAVATLAQLRRGAGKLPEDVPELWGVTGTERLFELFDDRALSGNALLRAEAALFLAVTLYALHQQSRPRQRMHCDGVDLGAAVRWMMPPGEIDEPIRRRLVRAGKATTLDTLAARLREIVTLLRRDSIPLDYALLARQLVLAQTPDGMRWVRQSWGRSFHAYRPRRPDTEPPSARNESPLEPAQAPLDDRRTTEKGT